MSRSKNSTIDYSKWDKMEFSDCDDDDEGQPSDPTSSACRPIVTRLDQPTSVTFGGEAATTAASPSTAMVTKDAGSKKDYGVDYSKWDSMDYGDDDDDNDDDYGDDDENDCGGDDRPTDPKPPPSPHPSPSPPQTDSSNGTPPALPNDPPTVPDGLPFSTRKLRLLTRNGGTFLNTNDAAAPPAAYWSQDRYEVVLSVAFDPHTAPPRDIRVAVTGALGYNNRCTATGVGGGTAAADKGRLVVSAGGGVVLVEGALHGFVYLPEGEEEEVEWEIDVATNPERGLVRVTLLKAVPMQGLTVWWSRPLEHFEEIDTQVDVEGRYGAGGGGGKDRSEKAKEAWDEAHRMFREKVKNREKQVIHT